MKQSDHLSHSKQHQWNPGRKGMVFGILLLVVVIAVLGIVLSRSGLSIPVDKNAVTFTSSPIAKGIPNTVVFHFDVGDLQPKKIEIQQSWDATKRVAVYPGMKTATSTYYYPGYFRAKLLFDGLIVQEHDLFIPSDGWLATLNTEPRPQYFLQEERVDREVLAVDEKVLEAAQNRANGPQALGFHYVHNFHDVSLDDFFFEATIRNTYAQGDAVCQMTSIMLLGTEGIVLIPFSLPGCVRDLRFVVNNVVHEGKSYDLSAFGWDFANWLKVRCTIVDRRARIYLNSRLVYGVEYTGGLGRFVGMRILFTGSGMVDDVLVKDGAENVIFEDHF